MNEKKIIPVYNILVVDDETTVARAIQMLLEHDGHVVQTVDGGVAALAILEQGKFDLVITDYSMQGMKGDRLVALIKQRWPDQHIIMATAFAPDFNTAGKQTVAADLVFSKPFSLIELRAAVATVLS